MSWLAKSIADTLSLNDDDDENGAVSNNQNPNSESSSPRGVKEDLSEITQTLSRQFWGVASFLSPPPLSPSKPDPNTQNSSQNREGFDGMNGSSDDREGIDGNVDEEGVGKSGIRSDLSEIGGRFKSGISKLSENMKVSEITKMATGWREFLEKAVEEMNEEEVNKAFGVTEEVVAFAKDIALHPGTWLDFPLPDDHMEEAFDMSDAQQEHALAVESLAPSLAALRMELCPEYISESSFWKIYFVLLHRILDKEAAVILSTPQVMEARALLTTDIQKHPKVKQGYDLSTTSIDQKDGSSLQHELSLSVPSGAPENSTETVVVPKSDASTDQKDGSILQPEVSLSGPSSAPENATQTVVVPKSDASTDQTVGSSLQHEVSLSGPSDAPENAIQTVVVPKSVASTESPDYDVEKNPTTNINNQIVEKSATSSTGADSLTDKDPIAPSDIQIDDKSIIEVKHGIQNKDQIVQSGPSNSSNNREEEDEDHDDWLKEEISELDAGASETTIPIENDEDVSFSDLEEDEEDAPSTLKKVNYTSDKDSREWVQL